MVFTGAILILLATLRLVNGQSQSSCLVQARFNATKSAVSDSDSPFSEQQQQCIDAYVADVRTFVPHFDLSGRFGGSASTGGVAVPILGAGFSTTSLHSLAIFGRQLGLKVDHVHPLDDRLDQLRNCTERKHLNVNLARILSTGSNLLVGTAIGEFFLDFYAASPESKVILDTKNEMKFFERHLVWQRWRSCDPSGLQAEDAARLLQSHLTLVRCMVPTEKLLETDFLEDSTRIASFLGVDTEFHVPFPQVGSIYAMSDNDADRLPICITGQIRRLELQSKIKRLIQPAVDAGHRVEVYLVLDPRSDTTFIHQEAGERVGNYTIAHGSFNFLNETAHLFPSNVSVIYDPFIPKDYIIDSRYASGLDALNESTAKKTLDRSKSHVRQWGAMTRCWELFHVINNRAPKAALRLRDDVVVMEKFLPPFESLSQGVHVPSCESFHGLNDKAAMVVGSGEMKNYFTMLLELMRRNFTEMMSLQRLRMNRYLQNHGTDQYWNAESVLFDAMFLTKTKVHFSDNFPLYRGTVLQNGKQLQICYPLFPHGSLSHCYSRKILQRLRTAGTPVFENAIDDLTQAAYLCDSELAEAV